MQKTFFVDLSRCTACRGCQVACKQWHKLPAEQTRQMGDHQNPADLSAKTYKLVRFNEVEEGGTLNWLFFPDQCRHCLFPPCKEMADVYVQDAILHDEAVGAVLFTEKLGQLSPEEKQQVRDACPYDIPRVDEQTGLMAKCTFCIDRVRNGLKPACVAVCPTGAMNFGDRDDMLALAAERLEKAKRSHPRAVLIDPDDVSVVFLALEDPALYYSFAMAQAPQRLFYDRRGVMTAFLAPFRRFA